MPAGQLIPSQVTAQGGRVKPQTVLQDFKEGLFWHERAVRARCEFLQRVSAKLVAMLEMLTSQGM